MPDAVLLEIAHNNAHDRIEAQIEHAGRLVRPVALEARVGKNRANLALKIDGWLGGLARRRRLRANNCGGE